MKFVTLFADLDGDKFIYFDKYITKLLAFARNAKFSIISTTTHAKSTTTTTTTIKFVLFEFISWESLENDNNNNNNF